MMDELEAETSLETYKLQLDQVETALEASGTEGNPALSKLKQDLQELIQLTQESLLSLKKSKLLSALDRGQFSRDQSSADGSTGHSDTRRRDTWKSSAPTATSCTMDAEFAAFQAAMVDTDTDPPDSSLCSSVEKYSSHLQDILGNSSISEQVGSNTGIHEDDSITEELNTDGLQTEDAEGIVGTKCRAPFTHDWGTYQMHNAMIVSVEAVEENEDPKVRVMFCHPTHRAMLPCPFFLDGRCRFTDDDCRYSHGHIVEVAKLEEYLDPDYSKLLLDTDCLAKDTDGIWYKATVVEVKGHDQTFQVMFEANDETATVEIEDVLPLESPGGSEIGDDEAADNSVASDTDSELEEFPRLLWQPGCDGMAMGEWEAHTRGIGSKLMAQMGYITGQGLGKNGEGRAEPVPIQLLPSGKSLDKIMELKALAADQDLYDVMKRQKRQQMKVDKTAAKSYKNVTDGTQSVFDFINKKLGNKRGNIHDLVQNHAATKKVSKVQHISESDLKQRSDRQINVQMLKTHEEIKSVEKEIVRLKEAVERNKNRKEHIVVSQLQKKISSMENYLERLQASEGTLHSQQKSRNDHKKLTIF